jgi:ADP-heptose:LPS heptosyltransferase
MPLFRDAPGVAQLVAGGDPLPAFDLQCPVPALPGAFGTVPDSVPPALAYRPPAGARNWDGIASSPARLRVGIVWAGNPDYSKDRGRSADLARLAPLFAVPGVSFVSLQRDVSARDIELLAQHGIPHTGPEQRDFGDAASLVERMDVVISVDTSVAHLAGSMGKPLWMLLSYSPDWRWGSEGGRSPWYPQAKLFRQERRGDWTAPVARVAEALAGLA